MNVKNILIAVLLVFCGLMAKGQGDPSSTSTSSVGSEISLRFVPASGGPSRLKAKTTSGANVKVGDQNVLVDKAILQKLKRNESAVYWYDISAVNSSSYVVRANTNKSSIGISLSHLFAGGFNRKVSWMPAEYETDFESPSYHLYDFSIGLLYAGQLFAVNRHRLSLEFCPSYRQMYHEFIVPRYSDSFASTDPEGTDYERLITVTNYTETYLTHSAALPLALRYDFFVFKYLSLYLTAGVENLFTLSSHSNAVFDTKYAGQYGEELFDVVIDQIGYYDFGTYKGLHFESKGEKGFRYALYGTASVGLQIFMGRNLSVEIAGVYQRLCFSTTPDDVVDDFHLNPTLKEHQSMMPLLPTSYKNRLGGNVRLKINF